MYLSVFEIFIKERKPMKMKIILLLIIIILSGCSLIFEKEKCPAYPAANLKWMPYIKDQALSFTNGTYVYELKVDHAEASKSHKVYKDLSGLYNCTPHALAEISSPTTYPKISIWSSISCEDCTTTANLSSLVYFSYNILEENNEGSFFIMALDGDRLYINREFLGKAYHAEILHSYHNGYKEYSKVVCIEYDTIHQPMDIYKLYIAESAGIIEYVRKKGSQSVYLIDK
jgi:hypothetical protein